MQYNTIPNRTLYIHDNLDILRGMNSESVDLIATDPPFNKGRDFHATPDSLAAGARFQDRWSWEADVHPDWVDSIKDDQPALYELIDLVKNGQSRDDLAAYLCWLGVRVIEMRRVLKADGSLYLHCDPTANSYIRAMLDGVFGHQQFRNEIVWAYTGPGSPKMRQFNRKHDTIYWYAKGRKWTFNKDAIRLAYQASTVNRGKYDSNSPTTGSGFRDVKRGKIPESWWRDIPSGGQISRKELLGYPTQKPLALYERIIKASSDEGDLVLDPFCGCATTLIAAETLNRHWIGIDLWEHAAATLQQRIGFPVHARREPPARTDDEADATARLPSVNRRQRRAEPWMRLSHADMRDILYAAQGGICAGCGRELHIRFMQLDHMQPRADGGDNTIDNRVMLCSPCNGAKGAVLTISGLVRANKRDGWLESEARRKLAHTRASLVGNTAKAKDGEALIGLVRGLAIDKERKAAIERTLAPPQSELALGV